MRSKYFSIIDFTIVLAFMSTVKYYIGSFTYEKYFSGKYLGELSRLVLVSVLAALGEPAPPHLNTVDTITTADVSSIVRWPSFLIPSLIHSILYY